jgi:hypothetical protein
MDKIEVGGYFPENKIRGSHVLFLASFHSNEVILSEFQALVVSDLAAIRTRRIVACFIFMWSCCLAKYYLTGACAVRGARIDSIILLRFGLCVDRALLRMAERLANFEIILGKSPHRLKRVYVTTKATLPLNRVAKGRRATIFCEICLSNCGHAEQPSLGVHHHL